MPPFHVTVSQIRLAAACPRILYFDAEHTRERKLKQPSLSRIWKIGQDDERTACGSLFHAAIEQFNRQAARDPVVRQALAAAAGAAGVSRKLLAHVYRDHVNRDLLFQKTGVQQQAFMAALKRYIDELADILTHAQSSGKAEAEILEEMFGDRRRRVDVTFDVGPAGEPVHVTGILDYVFYDWRTAHNRIIDYKLTVADKPTNDLFQVCLYALMHHVQHKTEPDVGVLYLHPARQMFEKSWEQVYAERHVVYNLLASMREWVRYDTKTGRGLKPPGEPLYCAVCRWNKECVRKLGAKHEGQRLAHWRAESTGTPSMESPAEPAVAVRVPDPPAPAAQLRHVGNVPPQNAVRDSEQPASEGRLRHVGNVPPLPPEDLFWIGASGSGESAVGLSLAALPTHVAVVGAAGSGKTWLAKVLAEEAIGRSIPVLAVDPQGDLVQFLKRRPEDHFQGEPRRCYERFWQLAEPRVLTPGTSHGTRLCLSPIRLPRSRELADLPDPQRRDEELTNLLTTVAGNLVNLAKASGEADCQRTFLFRVLQRLAEKLDHGGINLAAVADAVKDPDSVGIDDADNFIKKTDRLKVARKLNSILLGPAANLFGGGTALDLGTLLRPTRPGKVPLNVIYLNALPDDDQKQFFVAALAAEVYRWMLTTGSQSPGPRLLFYLDEARDFLPAGTRKPAAKEPLLRLFSQGRKYGVACLFCTQSPRSVEYQVFSNCSTKIIGRLESAQDVERVAEWFTNEGAKPPWLHARKGADKGTFVARWPDMPPELEGQTWTSRCLFSLHEGAWSPERVEAEVRAAHDVGEKGASDL